MAELAAAAIQHPAIVVVPGDFANLAEIPAGAVYALDVAQWQQQIVQGQEVLGVDAHFVVEGGAGATGEIPVSVIGQVDDGGLRCHRVEVQRQGVAIDGIGGFGVKRAGEALIAIARVDGEAYGTVRRLSSPTADGKIIRAAVQLMLAHVGGEFVLCAIEREAGAGDAARDASTDGASGPVTGHDLRIAAATGDDVNAIDED